MYATAGGILPALFWLWFWIREDKVNPEPRGYIFRAFVGGMIMVIPVYFLEKWVLAHFGGSMNSSVIFSWAVIEEMAKFLAAALLVLHGAQYDEPIDAPIYLLTTALGFAALENTLFILNPLIHGQLFDGLITGNMRFIGASLVHIVCSAILGYFIGREFYNSKIRKMWGRVVGFFWAIGLHDLFNTFIIYKNGSKTFIVFACVWLSAMVVLLLFERIKKVSKLK